MRKILIVEDEKPINDLIKLNLELVGYSCEQAFDGTSALARIGTEEFDLIILDVMLPGVSGFDIIGSCGDTPVIFVTAKGDISDRLEGLRRGADDYITKPFNILEMVERVNAVLRRARKADDVVSFGDVTADFSKRRVLKGGEEVHLKPKEFDLLEALVVNRNLALSREKLIELVWPMDFDGDERTVDIHVRRLRQKLGLEDRLITVFKTGYRLQI